MKLKKAGRHQYFWIKDSVLYESFKDSKGIDYSRKIMDVVGMMDEKKCSDACIRYIEIEFLEDAS